MAIERQVSRVAVRLLMAAGAAALMAGCSDASRFGDPFTDPFSSGSSAPQRYSQNSYQRGYDRAPTGSTQRYAPTHVESRPLAPVAAAPRMSTPAPIAAPVAAAAGGSRWSVDGGTPITVGPGDSAAILATRYGVPTDALLRANGYSSAAQVQPGTRLTIPVYRAQGAALPAAPVQHVAAAPMAKPAATMPAAPALSPRQIAEMDALKRRKAEAEAAEARQKEAEAKAAQRLAEAKAAEQKLAEAKAAESKKAELKAAELKKAEAKVAEAKSSDKKAAEAKLAAAKAESQKAEQAKLVAAKEAEKAQKASKLAEAQKATETAKTAKVADAKAKASAKVAAAPVEETEVAAPKAAALAPKSAAPAPKPAAPEPKAVAAAEPKKIDKTTTTASIPPAAAPASAAPAEEEKPVASADGKPEFRWPARGRIIQGYSSGGNDGINIAVPEGTPVKAAEGGTVAYAGSELKGYGNLVLIRHPNGFVTAYAHNGALNVKRGDSVKRGQTVATSGQSGNVGSPQLHFELRKGSQPVDPTSYMAGL